MKHAEIINEYLETHDGRYPRNDSLAKKLRITVDEATKLLDAHKAASGVRVRTPAAPEPRVKAVEVFDKGIVFGSIIIAAVLDLILTGFTLYIMGPSPLEKVAFVAIAFITVIFGLRALFVGNKVLFFVCALISSFLGISFVLVGIDYQTNLTADDRELVKLEKAESNAEAYLLELQALQTEKGEGYKSQVEDQQKVYEAASLKASNYRRQVADKPKEAPEIKAYDILLAIPKALTGQTLDSRWAMLIALVVFGACFFVLQSTMYTSVVKPSPDKN